MHHKHNLFFFTVEEAGHLAAILGSPTSRAHRVGGAVALFSPES